MSEYFWGIFALLLTVTALGQQAHQTGRDPDYPAVISCSEYHCSLLNPSNQPFHVNPGQWIMFGKITSGYAHELTAYEAPWPSAEQRKQVIGGGDDCISRNSLATERCLQDRYDHRTELHKKLVPGAGSDSQQGLGHPVPQKIDKFNWIVIVPDAASIDSENHCKNIDTVTYTTVQGSMIQQKCVAGNMETVSAYFKGEGIMDTSPFVTSTRRNSCCRGESAPCPVDMCEIKETFRAFWPSFLEQLLQEWIETDHRRFCGLPYAGLPTSCMAEWIEEQRLEWLNRPFRSCIEIGICSGILTGDTRLSHAVATSERKKSKKKRVKSYWTNGGFLHAPIPTEHPLYLQGNILTPVERHDAFKLQEFVTFDGLDRANCKAVDDKHLLCTPSIKAHPDLPVGLR